MENTGMKDLIAVVNRLQDHLTESGQSLEINLPQIVVVGCQSGGKSSVLENLVGSEFLPRGAGVVTKRPIIIHLIPCKEEYIKIGHDKFTSFEEARQKIEEETEKEVKLTGGFSSRPITVKIFSPHVLQLTLVDLPGLVKNPIKGQHADIVHIVQKMVIDFIKHPNSLILAISPANQDIATSDALNIAHSVDPKGERTISVLTKLDIMDEGTSAKDVLENKILPLKRGHIGVINRSQEDIHQKRDVNYARKKEQEFFLSHPHYRSMASKLGTQYLQQILSKSLEHHIKEKLPTIRKDLQTKLTALELQLEEMIPDSEDTEQMPTLNIIIRHLEVFTEGMITDIEGQNDKVNLNTISSGATISIYLYSEFQEALIFMKPTLDEVHLAVMNTSAIRKNIFTPAMAFDNLCISRVRGFEEPILKAVNRIKDILLLCMRKSAQKLKMYGKLEQKIITKVEEIIKHRAKVTKKHLKYYIEAEACFFTTDWLFDHQKISPQMMKEAGCTSSASAASKDAWDFCESYKTNKDNMVVSASSPAFDERNLILLQNLVGSYMLIIRKTVLDGVVKNIYFFFIKQVLIALRNDLIPEFVNIAKPEELLQTTDEHSKKIEEIKHFSHLYQDAIGIIDGL